MCEQCIQHTIIRTWLQSSSHICNFKVSDCHCGCCWQRFYLLDLSYSSSLYLGNTGVYSAKQFPPIWTFSGVSLFKLSQLALLMFWASVPHIWSRHRLRNVATESSNAVDRPFLHWEWVENGYTVNGQNLDSISLSHCWPAPFFIILH